MELLLLRHGIAIDREDPDCPPEEQRHLTAEGERRTRACALGLAALGVKPAGIYASPLLRTLQTASIAADVLCGDPRRVEEWPELAYWVEPELSLAKADALDDGLHVLVGHRPHLDLLLAEAVGADEPFTVLKKAGAALVARKRGRGELRWLLAPAQLRRLGQR
jgi:phosphohistidine phosphatase SixA